MRTFRFDYPRPSLAAWSRDARPVRLREDGTDQPPARDGTDAQPCHLDDLLFGCSTAALIFMTLALASGAFVA